MATLPTTLPNGFILIYGEGVTTSNTGITPDNTVFKFGTISQVFDGGGTFVNVNDQVMFKEEDVEVRLYYLNWPYTMIPARLVTKETPLP